MWWYEIYVCVQCSSLLLLWLPVILALLHVIPSQWHRHLMTIESVCSIDQDMHGKVEVAAVAVPEWPCSHFKMWGRRKMKNVENRSHSYVYVLGDVTGDLALCIRKVPFWNYAACYIVELFAVFLCQAAWFSAFFHMLSETFFNPFYLLPVYHVKLSLLVFPSYFCIYTLFKALCYKWLMHALLYYI